MALDFNEIDLINIKANRFDKLEHIFETLDNENETEILPDEIKNEFFIKPRLSLILLRGFFIMLKTVEISRAKKTAGIAVTYRAAKIKCLEHVPPVAI